MTAARSTSADMQFFSTLMRCGSLSAAARELQVTPPAVSKRLVQLETRLAVRLLSRSTRRVSLTPEGEAYLQHARRILADIEGVERELQGSLELPRGLVRVNATLGFGRMQVAPLISSFVRAYPQVQVQLQLSVAPPPLSLDQYDVCVRFGEPPEGAVVSRLLAPNRRLLCASPGYLARHGTPQHPAELDRHSTVAIRQGDDAYGVWRLRSGRRSETVKLHSGLSTNDGEIAVQWALAGHGIVMRAEWDIARYLRSGRLRQVLAGWETPPADVHAVYPLQQQSSVRVRAFVDHLAQHFGAAGASLIAR